MTVHHVHATGAQWGLLTQTRIRAGVWTRILGGWATMADQKLSNRAKFKYRSPMGWEGNRRLEAGLEEMHCFG